jgi:hypothetical protein
MTNEIITSAKVLFLTGVERVEKERLARGTPIETDDLRHYAGLPIRSADTPTNNTHQKDVPMHYYTVFTSPVATETGDKSLDRELLPPTNLSTVNNKNITVDKLRLLPHREKPGPKPKTLPVDFIKTLASQGLGSKAIATQLKHSGLEVSYKTIQRLIAGQGILVT